MGLNSPLPVRLEEETRKAAKILRSFVDVNNNGLDKVIPRHVLERAAGFAIFTVFKAGFVLSARAGSGIVIAKLEDGTWSAPSAIGLGGFGFGGQMGAEVTDFLIVLNSRSAVTSFMSAGNLTLGGNLSIAVGPLGRNAEGSGAVNTKGRLAAMYSYSKTKGLFGGVSVEGSVIVERQDANRIAYGGNPSAKQILSGTFDPPDWAHVLIEQLDKATGLPGGQRWKERDEDGEGGGMGYGIPERENGAPGGGYVFGQGVGAGGSTPPQSSGRRSRGNSLFGNNNPNDKPGSPSRPGNSRKGSSFNPFSLSGGSGSPRRNPLEHSSENYSSNQSWDSNLTSIETGIGLGIGNSGGKITPIGGRSRSGSMLKNGEVPQPFSYMNPSKSQQAQQASKEKDLLGDWESPNTNHSAELFSTLSPNRSNRKQSSGERDLLGTWESNGQNLSAQFSSLRTSDNGNSIGNYTRSRSNSKPTKPTFEDILENPQITNNQKEIDYTPRETESKFANMDWSNFNNNNNSSSGGSGSGSGTTSNFVSIASGRKSSPTKNGNTKKARPFSSYIGGSTSPSILSPAGGSKEFSPFEDLPVGRLRSNSNESKPFESYLSLANQPQTTDTQRYSTSSQPKPSLRLKEGLEPSNESTGYARAIGLYDFQSTQEGDLGFKLGDVIIVLDKIDKNGDWWKGFSPSTKKIGIFPSSYIEVVELPKNPKGGLGWGELRKRVAGNEFEQ